MAPALATEPHRASARSSVSRRLPRDVGHSGRAGVLLGKGGLPVSGAEGKAPTTRGSSGRKLVDEDESQAVQEESPPRVQVTEEKGPGSRRPDCETAVDRHEMPSEEEVTSVWI